MNTPPAQRLSQIGLVLLSLVVGLAMLELGLRAWNGYLRFWPNFVLDARTVHDQREAARFRHDAALGHVPRNGVRPNGTVPGRKEPPVLAVGDSFTYGDEVADGETWPAALQALTGRRTVNGGVSGYGFDQIVLRAEILARDVEPVGIVVSFIADDIRRTEMRRMWGAEKPYFDIEGDALVLRNVPVPPRPAPRSSLSWAQRTLGYSLLVDVTLRRLNLLHGWFGDHARARPSGTGERIACLLTERLAALQAASGARVIVMAQYDAWAWQDPANGAEQRRLATGLLGCAARQGLLTIDTYDALAGRRSPRDFYAQWHMNAPGNRLIAEIVAGKLDVDGH